MVIEDVDMGRTPGQESVFSTQSYLTDIEDKPVSDYPMQEEPEDGPSVVKELIGMGDSLADENRWTS